MMPSACLAVARRAKHEQALGRGTQPREQLRAKRRQHDDLVQSAFGLVQPDNVIHGDVSRLLKNLVEDGMGQLLVDVAERLPARKK